MAYTLIPSTNSALIGYRNDAKKVKSSLVPGPHYSARSMRFGSRGPSEEVRAFPARSPRIRRRNALIEKAWEIAVQELGKCATTSCKQLVSLQILNTLTSFLYCQ